MKPAFDESDNCTGKCASGEHSHVGLARTIYLYIRCVYSVIGREITKCTVVYGLYVRFVCTANFRHVYWIHKFLFPKTLT